MKIIKQNYRVVYQKGSYSLEIWLLETPLMEKVPVPKLNSKSQYSSSKQKLIFND